MRWLLLLGLLAGCDDAYMSCYANHTCQEGLVCVWGHDQATPGICYRTQDVNFDRFAPACQCPDAGRPRTWR